MISALKILFSIVFVWMCYVVVSTCLEHNLFKEWDYLGSIAWMRATLWDFYANILVIYIWICYKEKNWAWKIIWLVLLITLGSLASCAMVVIAGLRLGTHLAKRIITHLNEEEGRYQQLRKEWAPNAERKFFFFFQFQAISNVLLAVPFFIICLNTKDELSPLEYAGFILWFISVTGEAIADRQLAFFKKDPANKGKVCDTGLWNYSRHPNYFFEWLMWVSYFVFALASPYGYLAVISPAIILYLLLKVTGIPATEEQAVRSKGLAYKHYQSTTSVFVPWFKKGWR